MASTAPEEESLAATVSNAVALYRTSILQSELPSVSSAFQQTVLSLIDTFRAAWVRFQRSDRLSRNDDALDDLTLGTLRCLALPYFIGDLYQRVLVLHDTASSSSSASGAGGNTGSADGLPPTKGHHGTSESSDRARSKALAVSEHFFKEFLSLMVDLRLADEQDVEKQTNYSSNSRMLRIARSRKLTELSQKLRETDKNLAYELAKNRRLRELMAADGNDDDAADAEEVGGADEELLRGRETTLLEWCILDAISQLDLSSREQEMIGRLDEGHKRQIVQNYQAGIQHFKDGKNDTGRNTYTVLPGGLIAPGMMVPSSSLQDHSAAAAALAAATSGAVFREQVRAEIFLERNRPTMSLDEFAQQEMADVQRQMEAQAAGEAAHKEEDLRLGEEGVEERERVKKANWDDWRDANPPIGITTKGNYS